MLTKDRRPPLLCRHCIVFVFLGLTNTCCNRNGFGKNPSAQAPGGKMVSHSREEVEAFLAIFDGVADEMAEGWKEGETNLPVKRRMLDHLNAIIQNF